MPRLILRGRIFRCLRRLKNLRKGRGLKNLRKGTGSQELAVTKKTIGGQTAAVSERATRMPKLVTAKKQVDTRVQYFPSEVKFVELIIRPVYPTMVRVHS